MNNFTPHAPYFLFFPVYSFLTFDPEVILAPPGANCENKPELSAPGHFRRRDISAPGYFIFEPSQ